MFFPPVGWNSATARPVSRSAVVRGRSRLRDFGVQWRVRLGRLCGTPSRGGSPMGRHAGRQGADTPMGSPTDNEGLPNRRRWVFPAVAGGLTALWLVMSLPSTEDLQGEPAPYTTKRAGWPDSFARWSVAKDTG